MVLVVISLTKIKEKERYDKASFKLNKFDKMLQVIFRSICGFFSLFLSWFFRLLLFLSLFRFSLFLFSICLWLFLWWFFFLAFCGLFSLLFCWLFSLLLFLWLLFSLLFSFKKKLITILKSIIVWLIYWKSIYQNIFNILSSYNIKMRCELICITDIIH